MDLKTFFLVFGTVFLAELGDKTQLATLLFASGKQVDKWTVFFASSSALVLTSAIGVIVGAVLSQYLNEKYLHLIAGVGFVVIGALTLYSAIKG